MSDEVDALQQALAGHYLIERQVGQGGMARVYLARDLRHHRQVALKVLRPEVSALLGGTRFLREIETTASLQHPHILPLFDSGTIAGAGGQGAAHLYYVMPFVDQASLRDRLAREPRLSIEEAVRSTLEIGDALAYAHQRGLLHRDIKPENILLSGGHALLTDFGIAQALSSPDVSRLTATGVAVGTPLYMSPEQSVGDHDLDERSDLYALATVLYEMLAGRPPFAGANAASLRSQRLLAAPPPVSTLRPDVPARLDRALVRALRPERGERYPSVAAFCQALREATAGAASSAGSRRGWWIAAGAVALVGLVAAGILRSRSEPDHARVPRSLAVLPFTSGDQDTSNAYFGAGIAEELTTAFARIPGLRVASRGSASRYQEAGSSDQSLAAGLGVETLLEGTVRRSGPRIRVTARLIEPRAGTVLWAEEYDRQQQEIFALQDEITRAIVTALSPTFTGTPVVAAAHPEGTIDPEVYDLYLKGRYQWRQRGAVGLRAAIGFYTQALRRDSSFARAWAGLSMAQVVLPLFEPLREDSVLDLASRNARRALQLDSTLADAHLALAYTLKGQWQWGAADQEFQRALAIDPEDATIHHWYAVLLEVTGRIGEALQQLQQARQLDPLALQIQTDEYYALYLAGRYEEALATGQRVWAMDTTRSDGALQLGLIQLARGHADSGLAEFQLADRLGTGFDMRAFESVAARRLGRVRQADSLYHALTAAYGTNRTLAYAVALAAAAAGDLDRGMAAIQETVRQHSVIVTELNLPCEPLFDPLKRDPRFVPLLTQSGMRVCGKAGT